MTTLVDRLWYGVRRPLWPLWPLAWLFRWVSAKRRHKLLVQAPPPKLGVPVVVVGNITAGGTGKSPLTAWLVAILRNQGWRPVILTRGYGGRAERYPLVVDESVSAEQAGDEPVMLWRQSSCPVVVDPERYRGAQWAIQRNLGDVLICDDGLQHYKLPRDIELAVFDGRRGLGNGAPIPVGPLREPASRLASVDFVITNGSQPLTLAHPAQFCMTLKPRQLRHLRTSDVRPLDWLQGRKVRAVAGIGNPQRFFDTLVDLGANVRARPLPDHHQFKASDLTVEPDEVLVVTAKDAVKCAGVAPQATWVLEVEAELPASFETALMARLSNLEPRVADFTLNKL